MSTQRELMASMMGPLPCIFNHLLWEIAQSTRLYFDDTGVKIQSLIKENKATNPERKGMFSSGQDRWAVSDTQAAFRQALKERGFTLARGDRRGFVALDCKCNPFSISKKWIGVSTKEVRGKLTDQDALPSVDEAKSQIAKDMQTRLGQIWAQQNTLFKNRAAEIRQKRLQMATQHKADRQALKDQQVKRWHGETRQRQERFNKGLRGIMDRVTGK